VNEELAEIVAGLKKPRKMISPKYFYDERGSQLFDAITHLPEYYPTETEFAILHDNIDEIAEFVGSRACLIEYGSGSSRKTRVLLEHLHDLAAYMPVDISEDHLLASADKIRADFPELDVLPVVADFTKQFAVPHSRVTRARNIVYFPGSTIGNFTNDVAQQLLDVMYEEAGENGAMLIGVDLQKESALIERAYNDSAGLTAEFNLNMLTHLNREFGFDFDVGAYSHSARYDEKEGRMVIELISAREQVISVGDERIDIADGEAILTEYSHKYTLEGFATMAEKAGFKVAKVWMDTERLFSVQYCVR
jgi:L-histidine N-alpha-methyltransferase